MTREILHALILSLSLGMLIGLVRQWEDQRENNGAVSAGLRTFALWAVFGFMSGLINDRFQHGLYLVGFAIFGLFLIITQYLENQRHSNFGTTTTSIGFLTFLIGSLVFWGETQLALTLTICILILLSIKKAVHQWTQKLTSKDIFNALQFAAITGIILPLVPNQGFGPFNAINPYSIWMMVILISGLGFFGYLAMRILGARAGITLTGIFGGLASSTATTLAFSRRSKAEQNLAGILGIGIVAACSIMLLRVATMILFIDISLFQSILPAFCIMILPGIGYYLIMWMRTQHQGDVDTPELINPLSLKIAIKFALLYGVITLVVRAAREWSDDSGSYYLISFLSGLTDIDAIALSLANLTHSGDMLPKLAGKGILLAAVANTIFKLFLALTLGHRDLKRSVAWGLGWMLLAAIPAFLLIP
jgi:uncharacterized membrane protein (DUF4010 family)